MQNYFRFNVAKNGRHFFATEENSVIDAEKAEEVFTALKEKFTESDGYSITCTYLDVKGYHFDPNSPNGFREVIKKAYS